MSHARYLCGFREYVEEKRASKEAWAGLTQAYERAGGRKEGAGRQGRPPPGPISPGDANSLSLSLSLSLPLAFEPV